MTKTKMSGIKGECASDFAAIGMDMGWAEGIRREMGVEDAKTVRESPKT
jgi:hypothetical protein